MAAASCFISFFCARIMDNLLMKEKWNYRPENGHKDSLKRQILPFNIIIVHVFQPMIEISSHTNLNA